MREIWCCFAPGGWEPVHTQPCSPMKTPRFLFTPNAFLIAAIAIPLILGGCGFDAVRRKEERVASLRGFLALDPNNKAVQKALKDAEKDLEAEKMKLASDVIGGIGIVGADHAARVTAAQQGGHVSAGAAAVGQATTHISAPITTGHSH